MGFSGQDYRSGWPLPSTGGFPDPGLKPASPSWQADSLLPEPAGETYPCTGNLMTGVTFHCIPKSGPRRQEVIQKRCVVGPQKGSWCLELT